jgi:putative ABC transport system permease protein
MKLFLLAFRLLKRDFRAGELSLLALALLIAVSGSTAVTLFADRMQRTMHDQAAEFLAGDAAISGSTPVADAWLVQAKQTGLNLARTTEFSSVLLENNEMLLAAVKAVSARYPLRGNLKIVDHDNRETASNHGPPPGEAWVERRVLTALRLNPGDKLTVGEKTLTITRILTYEPDKRSNFYNFSPRVMMHEDDLQATKVIQPGSRIHYEYQFSGAESALSAYKDWLKPQLLASQRLLDIHDDRPELGSALSRAEQYLGLSSIVVVLIAGVAIVMATRRYTERHYDAAAILRCLGCTQQTIVGLFGYQFLILGFLTGVAGCFLGWLAQQGLFYLLKELLPPQLAEPELWAYFSGIGVGFLILSAFALPPLLGLRNVSALRVLRRELEPLSSGGFLIYALTVLALGLLIWRYTANLKMTAVILGVGFAALLVMSFVIYLLITQSRKLLPFFRLSWRFGMQGLLRKPALSISQILAFSIALTAMAISFVMRNDLIDDWRRQLPENAPNHFALNIFAEQFPAVQSYLQQAQINASRFYPVVRGRLQAINGTPVQQRVSKDSAGEEATRRDLSLTWADQLPEDNKITAGEQWRNLEPGSVSVEQKLAASLGLEVGDQLTFQSGGDQFTAKVVNIRSVRWDTMRPNFYMIFSPGSLDNFPVTYITSFYLAEQQQAQLNGLLKQFPAITILEVDAMLRQFKTILTQITQAVNLLLWFALLAGFSVLFAAVNATLDQRIYEGALLRTLGAPFKLLRRAHLIEFALLGGLSGFFAAVTSEAILYVLYNQVIHMAYHPSLYLWLALPACGMLGVGLAGYWGVRTVLKQPPLPVLRRL